MKTRRKRFGFSLVELVIVVVIIGVIAAIAVPRISRGAKDAGAAALRGTLAGVRNAIDMYAAEHNSSYPDGDSVATWADAGGILDQLTNITDVSGDIAAADATHIYGPYLRADVPPLPVCNANVKGLRTVKVVTPVAPNGEAVNLGYHYDPTTGTFVANCANGDTDDAGIPYNEY